MFLSRVMKMFQLQSKVSKSLLSVAAIAGFSLGIASTVQAGVQLEIVAGNGQSEFLPATPQASGTYTSSNGTFGGFNWGSISVTPTNNGSFAELSLSIGSLSTVNSSIGGVNSISILASGDGFTYLPTGTNYLQTSGGGDYSNSTSGDSISMSSSADQSNVLYGSGVTISPTNNPIRPATSSTTTPYTLDGNETNTGFTGEPYSLTVSTTFNILSTSASYGGTFNSIVSNTPITASTPIPATGLLSLVGGLVMVGGVAIRRRMKA